jgi:hypothetical protein
MNEMRLAKPPEKLKPPGWRLCAEMRVPRARMLRLVLAAILQPRHEAQKSQKAVQLNHP